MQGSTEQLQYPHRTHTAAGTPPNSCVRDKPGALRSHRQRRPQRPTAQDYSTPALFQDATSVTVGHRPHHTFVSAWKSDVPKRHTRYCASAELYTKQHGTGALGRWGAAPKKDPLKNAVIQRGRGDGESLGPDGPRVSAGTNSKTSPRLWPRCPSSTAFSSLQRARTMHSVGGPRPRDALSSTPPNGGPLRYVQPNECGTYAY